MGSFLKSLVTPIYTNVIQHIQDYILLSEHPSKPTSFSMYSATSSPRGEDATVRSCIYEYVRGVMMRCMGFRLLAWKSNSLQKQNR